MRFPFSRVLAPARCVFAIGVAALISSVCAVAQNFLLIPAPALNAIYKTLYNPADGFLYAYTSGTYSVPAVISQIDPKTARTVASISLQQTLSDVKLAPAGDYLYVAGLATINAKISRYRLPDFSLDAQFQLPNIGAFYGMAVSPSDSHIYVIAADQFQRGLGVALYRDGTQIGSIVAPPAASTITSLVFASGSRLLTLLDRGEIDLFINAGGLSWDGVTHTISNIGNTPHLLGNLLYTSTGLDVDINSWEIQGSFPATSPFDLSSSGDTGFYRLGGAVGVFSTANFNLRGTITLPTETLWAASTCGPNTLAVSMDKGIYLVPISTVSPVPSTAPVPTAVAGQPIQELALTAAGMTYDKKRQLVYLVTSGSVGQLGNAVVVLDPLTAAVQNYAYVGSNPSQIVMSDSGNAMHVALSGSRSVATLNPLSLSTASTTPLWDLDSSAMFPPYFVAAVPGSDTTLVASRSLTPFDILPTQFRRPSHIRMGLHFQAPFRTTLFHSHRAMHRASFIRAMVQSSENSLWV